MDQHTIDKLKHRLEEELSTLESELKDTATETEVDVWEADAGDIDETATEEDEIADNIEELEENTAETDAFKIQLKNVQRALEKIDAGTYGVCEIGGEEIEEDRLDAIPSARTCKAHMDEEAELGA